MKRSIFSKIFLSFFLIVFILSSLILVFSFYTIRSHYIQTLTTDLKNLAITLQGQVNPYLEQKDFKSLDEFVKELSKKIQTRITIVAEEGEVLADSEKDPSQMENHKNRPEIYTARNEGVGSSLRLSATVKEEMLYVAIPVDFKNNNKTIVRVSLFLRDINGLIHQLKIQILEITFVIILLVILIAFLIARSFSNPIKELSSAAKKVSDGNYEVKVFLKNQDEIKELADSFNEMTDRVRDSFGEISNQKKELNGIISSMQEGLLVLGSSKQILIYNTSFEKMIGENIRGEVYFGEVITNVDFLEFIKKIYQERKSLSQEITIKEKTFLCNATFLESREEAIFIFHDITESKRLEKVKKDFAVNVSHELKTPLTSIKGFVEMLDEEVSKDAKPHLEIVKRNTERLIRIVQDLLLLSEIEDDGYKLQKESVNLTHLIQEIIQNFEKKINDKDLSLQLDLEDSSIIEGDPFKLEQIFINLIDNAVKYTEKGFVSISLKNQSSSVAIEVKDTGPGIPEEHLSRIFERFYVVDKSRSKKVGGTGLGLSLVKHITNLHNGSIDVSSTYGVGTTFNIQFPKPS